MTDRIPVAIRHEIEKEINCSIKAFNFSSGGCINDGGKVLTSTGDFFLKWNSASKYPDMFNAESKGLKLLRATDSISIPQVILTGITGTHQYILLAYVHQAAKKQNYWSAFGEQLAQLHRTSSDSFGLDHDNYIGSLPQSNRQHPLWVDFFICERMRPQIELAKANKLMESDDIKLFEKLLSKLPEMLPGENTSSLLHGDLWSGNLISGSDGMPCLIDPAVYFGNREAELAFTRLFGGFSNQFYESYYASFPVSRGFNERIDLYNLYPILVHLNLFGKVYLGQAVSIARRYV